MQRHSATEARRCVLSGQGHKSSKSFVVGMASYG
jgi:hypothetical protein